MTNIFPVILMALDLVAAVAYACNCDGKRAIYRIAAATPTATVTFQPIGEHNGFQLHPSAGVRF